MWCYVGAVEEMMCVGLLQRGDRCDLTSTLCMYDLRKDDLFDLTWTRCLETIDVCIWCMFVVCLCGGLWECLLFSGYCW